MDPFITENKIKSLKNNLISSDIDFVISRCVMSNESMYNEMRQVIFKGCKIDYSYDKKEISDKIDQCFNVVLIYLELNLLYDILYSSLASNPSSDCKNTGVD